jgi:hypothetical protein
MTKVQRALISHSRLAEWIEKEEPMRKFLVFFEV